MIHNKNFPFDGDDREIVHISPNGAAAKKMGLKIVGLSLLFASLMFGAKYAYDLGRGTKNFTEAPLVVAKTEPYKVEPENPGGMIIPYIDKEIYKNLNPAFIDQNEDVQTMPEAEKPMEIDALASLIENDFNDDFDLDDEQPVKKKSVVEPQEKPQSYKLNSDGKLQKTKGYLAQSSSNAKKINVTKILAKQEESEIWVQLGTFPNEAEATKAWQNVTEKNSDILNGAKIKISKSDLGDTGVFYRLKSGPFQSESEAREICKAMNDREQNCFFVKQNTNNKP